MKKLFYRTDALKIRDLIDVAVVVKNRDRDVLKYLDILRNKKEALQVRFNKIEEIYNVEVNKLYIIDKKLAKEALAVVNEFFRRTLFK